VAVCHDWDKALKRYDIRFDIDAKEPPYFYVANAAFRKAKGNRYLKLTRLLVLDTQKENDQKELQHLAREIKVEGLCDGMDAMEVYARLDRIRKIREKDLITVTVNHELEDVVEIFSRLNSRGTRVTEADIYWGVVAARAPGWVRDEFLPFLKSLEDYGFDLSPNLLFRSLTAIAAGKTRFKEIPDTIWNAESIRPAWTKCQRAWKSLVKRLVEYGVLSNEPLPTQAALVTLITIQDKFPDEPSFDNIFYWFLQASRFGRYSSSGSTSLDEDVRDIRESGTVREAVIRLMKRFVHTSTVDADDMLRDYSDSAFGRFLLYLLIYRNEGRDWDENGFRLGFEGPQVLADFRPRWHHIFPKKFLSGKFDDDQINALANIAVIGPTINIRISSKNPMDYLDRYKISADKLGQQFIPSDRNQFQIENFPTFLSKRASVLSQQANLFLRFLSEGIET